MRIKILLAFVFGWLSLLTACAQMNPHPMDMELAIKKATTRADHEALARHYEDTARELQAKVNERKKLLGEYEAHAAYYGRQALDLQSHTRSAIMAYEQAVKANMDIASSHRLMAETIK